MRWPVANFAYPFHQLVQHFVLMLCDEVADGVIKIKGGPNSQRGNDNCDYPKNPAAIHKLSSRSVFQLLLSPRLLLLIGGSEHEQE